MSQTLQLPTVIAALSMLSGLGGCEGLPPAPGIGAQGGAGGEGLRGTQNDGGLGGIGGVAGTGSTGGVGGAGGAGGIQAVVPIDPPLETKAVYVACGSNLTESFESLPWVLSIDPVPIEGGREFSAGFSGVAVFSKAFLDIAQTDVFGNGIREVNLLEFDATVIAEVGATGEDVVLTNEPIDPQCALENPPGTRPSCDPANDEPDGSNSDCQPQGTFNRCGHFVSLPTSDDCSPNGTCWDVGREAAAGTCPLPQPDFCTVTAKEQCLGIAPNFLGNGFCVTGPLEVPLTSAVHDYVADDTGDVRFSWYKPTPWDVPESIFADDPTPIGIRLLAGPLGIALDCVASSESVIAAPEPEASISFPIPDGACTDGTSVCPFDYQVTGGGRCRLDATTGPTTVGDPSGAGLCGATSSAPVDAFLPVQEEAILNSPSLLVAASVHAKDVVPASCDNEAKLYATVAYRDEQLTSVQDSALTSGPPEVSVSVVSPDRSIRSTQIVFVGDQGGFYQWSAGPDVCCERTFETTFTVTVAQCEGWGTP